MDNQFENYYGFEPQKPLTEKKNTADSRIRIGGRAKRRQRL